MRRRSLSVALAALAAFAILFRVIFPFLFLLSDRCDVADGVLEAAFCEFSLIFRFEARAFLVRLHI